MPSNPIPRLIKPDPYEDFFRSLADSLDDAVLLLSADAERLIVCNHAFLLLSGYARPEIEALSPADLFPDEAGQYGLTRPLETGAAGGRSGRAPPVPHFVTLGPRAAACPRPPEGSQGRRAGGASHGPIGNFDRLGGR